MHLRVDTRTCKVAAAGWLLVQIQELAHTANKWFTCIRSSFRSVGVKKDAWNPVPNTQPISTMGSNQDTLWYFNIANENENGPFQDDCLFKLVIFQSYFQWSQGSSNENTQGHPASAVPDLWHWHVPGGTALLPQPPPYCLMHLPHMLVLPRMEMEQVVSYLGAWTKSLSL